MMFLKKGYLPWSHILTNSNVAESYKTILTAKRDYLERIRIEALSTHRPLSKARLVNSI